MAEPLQGSQGVKTNPKEIGQDSVLHLPPSNLEVKIRTMATDIESVQKGGGLLGIAEKISISIPKEVQAPAQGVSAAPESGASPKSKAVLYTALGVGGVLVLFGLGYFLPQLLDSSPKISTPSKPVSPPATSAPVVAPLLNTSSTATPPLSIPVHSSFFVASGTPAVNVVFAPGEGRDYWSATIENATSGIFSEIFLLDSAGSQLPFGGFLSQLGIKLTDPNLFSNDFLPSYGAYVFRVGTSSYPGYVFKLKPDAISILVKNDLLGIESESAFIQSLFVNPPGNSATSFSSGQVTAGQIRELMFANRPSAFVYGLFRQYLVIGASEEAVSAAVSRL